MRGSGSLWPIAAVGDGEISWFQERVGFGMWMSVRNKLSFFGFHFSLSRDYSNRWQVDIYFQHCLDRSTAHCW